MIHGLNPRQKGLLREYYAEFGYKPEQGHLIREFVMLPQRCRNLGGLISFRA